MARKRIDWETLEPALRKLRKDALLQVLHHAYQALPASRIGAVFGEHVDLTLLNPSVAARKGAEASGLLRAVKQFHADSLSGEYYESFNVNSRNFMDKSEGTELWISECNQLFDKGVELSRKGTHAEVRTAMDLLFELLDALDSGEDGIVFFADEGGSWQVGVDEDKVLPAYFTSLAAVVEPEEYASRVLALIEDRGSYDSRKLLSAARKAANEAQRKALRAANRKP